MPKTHKQNKTKSCCLQISAPLLFSLLKSLATKKPQNCSSRQGTKLRPIPDYRIFTVWHWNPTKFVVNTFSYILKENAQYYTKESK